MSRSTATLLVNPAARGVKPSFDPSRAARYLEKRGLDTTLVVPDSAAGATAAAHESASRGDTLLFAIGGDGTVRDVALGLAGSRTALAAVPSGTVNIWAKEAGIPTGIRKAFDAHLEGQSVHIDLGRAEGRSGVGGHSGAEGETGARGHCFLLMAGIGWDAEIAGSVSPRLKKAIGDLAYIARGLRMAPGLRTQPASWLVGGERTEDDLGWMVLGNSRLYGGRVHLTADAAIDDGQLDVLAFCPRGLADTLRLAGKVVAGRREDSRLHQFRTSELQIETPGLAVQLDGDYAGETPMTFSVDRSALLVSIPSGPLPAIFGRGHTDRRKP